MAEWNRLDIVEAHALLEMHYNVGGILRERPSNARRNESTGVQLHRMGFRAPPTFNLESASDNTREIYFRQVLQLRLPLDDPQDQKWVREIFGDEELVASGHPAFAAGAQPQRERG